MSNKIDSESYLSVRSVSKSYGKKVVLKDVSLDIKPNKFVSLLGPSGCGKTTLLRIIAGLEKNHIGDIVLKGRSISNLSVNKRNFGMVFQSYALFPNMTAWENIEFGLKNKKIEKTEREKIINEVIDLVDLKGTEKNYPSQLSGGQQQRVALARVLVLKPDILLLDEPLSALDAKVREKLRYQIKKLHSKLNITTVMVTHDQEEALTMSDLIAVMHNGSIVQYNTPEEIYNKPVDKFVADFIGTMNFISVGNKIKAIRPENLILKKDSFQADGYIGRILDIEFRGSFYWITVVVNQLSKNYIICETCIEEMLENNFQTGSNVKVIIPEEKIIYFGEIAN